MKELITFNSLPLSNSLINTLDDKVKKYDLKIVFDEDIKLVHVHDNVSPNLLFPDTYVYDSAQSNTMIEHFKKIAFELQNWNKFINYNAPLEIGSNSGIFIEHFDKDKSVAVEPCKNFSDRTSKMGIKTYSDFWTVELAKEIVETHGKRDMIFSANTVSHIQDLDECFNAINECITDDGVVIIETPSLHNILRNNIFDQFYHEHQSYFSAISINNILKKYDLHLRDAAYYENIHGGTYRFFIHKKNLGLSERLVEIFHYEKEFGIDDYDKIMIHINKMKNNIRELKKLLLNMKILNKRIIGYGATAKFTQIANICWLNSDIIDYVVDTTPDKWNKFIPGCKIPILKYSKDKLKEIDHCFLGAWNYKDEIIKKENDWVNNGGTFITHVPTVRIL